MKRPLHIALRSAVLAMACCSPLLACAFEFEGDKEIRALLRDGSTKPLGRVRFTPQTDAAIRFSIRWNSAAFQDHFLSMREFKCLTGPDEIACHVPYPHKQAQTFTPDDMSWLEHNLMFMFKLPSEFGAKLWNGMYFKLHASGTQLVGLPQSIDLNQIAAPPDQTLRPPYGPEQRSDMDAAVRWLQQITIE